MLVYAIIFFIGLCLGSFINVLIYRLDREDGIVSGRSHCPKCNYTLEWYDLIPVASFLFLGGKCRKCDKKISYQYPVVEMLAGIILASFWMSIGLSLTLTNLIASFILLGLLTLAVFDYKYFILPDKVIIFLTALAGWYAFLGGFLMHGLLIGLILYLIFDIIFVSSGGEWMGFGDVKLVFLVGLLLGYPLSVVAIFMAVWSAAIIGLYSILRGGASLKTALPFGTFLSFATIIVIIFYNRFSILLSLF